MHRGILDIKLQNSGGDLKGLKQGAMLQHHKNIRFLIEAISFDILIY